MRAILVFLPALACAGVMLFCVRTMFGRGKVEAIERPDEVAELRAEITALRSRIDDGAPAEHSPS